MKRISFLILVSLIILTGCLSTSGTSSVSAIEKRQIEQRLLDYPLDVIYGSVLAILTDQGYVTKNSDKAGGLIVAEKFGERRRWGLVGYDRDVFSASIVLYETAPKQTSIRYTIRKHTFSNMGYGEGINNVEEILDPGVSQAFYALLKTEAERRMAGFK